MPPDLFSPVFDYCHADGLGRARQRDVTPNLDGQVFRADAIGPIVELTNLVCVDDLSFVRDASWFDEGRHALLLNALGAGEPYWMDNDRNTGLIQAGSLIAEDRLTEFKIDAHLAAKRAGFGSSAALIAAALGELIGNVLDHSGAFGTGIAIFSGRKGLFELVVADRGIGALRSLRQCSEYVNLRDEGAALSAMIEAGVSRFGPGSNHGNGFRPLFERLADMTGQLRFRSGDFALSIDGRFGDRIARQLAQKPPVMGLFAAVLCRSGPVRLDQNVL